MSVAAGRKPHKRKTLPAAVPPFPVKRFTLAEYERLTTEGLLCEDDKFELLNGWIISKMSINPPHAFSVSMLNRLIGRLLPADLTLRVQDPIALPAIDSSPEPDIVIASGPPETYADRHPGPRDVLLVMEVAETSLELDQGVKLQAYAAEKIPQYWIVDLRNRAVIVHTQPRGGRRPSFENQTEYRPGDEIPIEVNERRLGALRVSDFLK